MQSCYQFVLVLLLELVLDPIGSDRVKVIERWRMGDVGEGEAWMWWLRRCCRIEDEFE